MLQSYAFLKSMNVYDNIDRKSQWKILEKHRLPHKLINLTEIGVQDSRAKIRVDRELSEDFAINIGVRQGDGISPILLNLALVERLQKTKELRREVKVGADLNILAFANDVVLPETVENLSSRAEVFTKEGKKMELNLNKKKKQR